MKKHKITNKENKKNILSKSILIACAVIVGLNIASSIKKINIQKQREEYRQQYTISSIANAKVTNVNNNFTQILWLNYLSATTKDETIALAIDDCLNNLTKENFSKVNSLVETKDQYENSIFSDIVTIENLEGYYVNCVDLGKRKITDGKIIDVERSNCVSIDEDIYIAVDELLEFLYDDYKGELKSITF